MWIVIIIKVQIFQTPSYSWSKPKQWKDLSSPTKDTIALNM